MSTIADTLDLIGSKYEGVSEVRDAVHFAVITVEAGQVLDPGEKVYMKDGKARGGKEFTRRHPAVGVVDPFLSSSVAVGEKFFLFLAPKSTYALRHTWLHEDFPEIRKAATNEIDLLKLENIGNANGLSLTTILEEHRDEWCKNDDDDLTDEFWSLYEKVTGIFVPHDERYVRCAC